jgi:hypothetical protein
MNSSETKPAEQPPLPRTPPVSGDRIKLENLLFAVTVMTSLLALVYYINWP